MKGKATLLSVLLFVLCIHMGFSQQRTITGVVKSAETGETLPGVAVIEKGTRNGTATDYDGRYELTLTTTDPVLVFQSIGMETREIPIGTEDVLNVQLEEATDQLEEVVVTALGVSQEKRSLGFTTSSVDEEEITKGGDRSALDAIRGKVPGVNITSASGNPGASSRIIIRGAQSVTQNNQPLFVVDGVPIFNNSSNDPTLNGGFDFGNGANAINPEDIENISILKGASATALYGSRAANGVVLITTKKGKKSITDKPRFGISYSGNVSFSNVLRLPNFQNTFGQGWDGTHLLGENGSWGPRFDGRERVWGNVVDNSQLLKPYEALPTNVEDFFTTGVNYQNSVSFSGGDQKGTYYVSFSNVNSDGVFPTDADSYERNTIALRGSREAGMFNFSGSFNLSLTNSSFVPTGQGPTVYNNIMQIPRDISIVDMEDYTNKFYNIDNYFTYYGVINPYYTLNEFGSKFRGNKIFGGMEVQAELAEWSGITYRFGYDISTDRYNTWEAIIAPSPGSPNEGTSIEDLGSARERLYTQRQLNHDLIYNMNFDLTETLKLDALVGANYNERRFNDLDLIANDLSIPGFYDLSNSPNPPGTVPNKNYEDEMLRRYGGIYAQTNFAFRNYLFLNLTARNDWSSTLPLDNNSYFYYGANMSWVFTDVLEINRQWLNYGKLRLGYGTTGNDAQPYQIYDKFVQKTVQVPFVDYQFPVAGVNAFSVSNLLGNPNLNPEITSEFEIGGEFRLFTRVTLDVTYYHRVTDDLILNVPIGPETGYTNQIQNVGEIENKGIEALVSIDILKSDDLGGFTWNLGVNYTQNNNKVLALNEGTEKVQIGGLSTIGFFAVPGMPMGVFEGRVPLRTEDGKIIVDANGVPIATTEKEFYGDAQYDYIMGINNRFGYKGFSLSATIDIRQGGLMYSRTADINNFTGNGIKTTYNERRPFVVPNSVQEDPNNEGQYIENTNAIDQEHMDDYFRATALEQDYVIDKSFIKLREIVLSYQMPRKWLDNTPIASLSLSIFGRNLLLFTPEDNQFVDPEITTFGNDIEADFGEFSSNPSVRTYGVGLRASF